MSARYQTTGSDNWRYRQGYQYSQRLPAPIMLIERPSVWARLKGLAK